MRKPEIIILAMTANQVIEENKITVVVKPKRAYLLALPRRPHDHNKSLGIVFCRKKNEIKDYIFIMY